MHIKSSVKRNITCDRFLSFSFLMGNPFVKQLTPNTNKTENSIKEIKNKKNDYETINEPVRLNIAEPDKSYSENINNQKNEQKEPQGRFY